MDVATTRFGRLTVDDTEVLHFPTGLIGLEAFRQWILLADAQSDAFGWLQSLERPDLAVAVVVPRRFVPGYELRIAKGELAPLGMADASSAQVLAIVSQHGEAITLNLKAPLVVDVEHQVGRQVVASGDAPLQHVLVEQPAVAWRKSA